MKRYTIDTNKKKAKGNSNKHKKFGTSKSWQKSWKYLIRSMTISMGSLFNNCGAATEKALFSPGHFCIFMNQEVQAVTRASGNWAKAGSVNHQTIIHVLGQSPFSDL